MSPTNAPAEKHDIGEGSKEEDPLGAIPINSSINVEDVSPIQISPYIIIPLWISLSAGLILFNKWIFTSRKFTYPVFLTAYHMAVAMIGTRILKRTTTLLADTDDPLPRRVLTHAILPAGLLYAFSLVLSNAAYLHLSISFIQMIKASTPVLLHLICCVAGLAILDKVTAGILIIISTGCIIASTGELRYNYFGLVCQMSAVVTEATRLAVIQMLLRNIKMNPLVSIYYFAPVCLTSIALVLPFLEGTKPFYALQELGLGVLVLNGVMAFALNLSSMILISQCGSLVSTLSGVLKDILLITISVTVLGSTISLQQVFGYSVTLVGLLSFKERQRITEWIDSNRTEVWSFENARWRATRWKTLVVMCLGLVIAGTAYSGGISGSD